MFKKVFTKNVHKEIYNSFIDNYQNLDTTMVYPDSIIQHYKGMSYQTTRRYGGI